MRVSRGTSSNLAKSPRGFSLLEIVIVLTLGALLVGGALGYLIFSSSERRLKYAGGEIETLAKKARTVSMLQQTSYALVMDGEGVKMMPLAESMQEAQGRIGPKSDKNIVAENLRFTPVHAEWYPEEGDRLFVKRWATDAWLPADARSRHVWRFDPDGLCEPLSIRLEIGDSYIEKEFNPLTAAVRYTTLEAHK